MLGQKKLVHRVQRTEGKRNIFHQFLEEYDIQTAVDILEALKDVLGETSEKWWRRKWMIIRTEDQLSSLR